jgi:hypothetical protein
MFRVSPPQVRGIRQQMPEKSGFFSWGGFPDSLQGLALFPDGFGALKEEKEGTTKKSKRAKGEERKSKGPT